MYLGVMDNHGEREAKGPRGYNMGELQAPDLAIWGVGKVIFSQNLIFKV
jgi:hypothetical protein